MYSFLLNINYFNIKNKQIKLDRRKQNLFVTYPMNMYNREAGVTLSKPSRFITEISSDQAQGWLVEDDY
ncbi:MAG TPA: hypothetical protein VH917_02700 [Ignavibacteriaceae bacterium]